MPAGLIVVVAGVAGTIVMLAMSRLRRGQPVDLGTVSHQWISEQRLGRGPDSRA